MPTCTKFSGIDIRLAALLIGVTLATVDSSALNLALPSLAVYFQVDASRVQGAASFYLIGSALAFLPLTSIAGKIGTVKIYRFSLFAFSVISLFLAIAPELSSLLVLRFVQGIAGAGVFGLVPGLVMATFPEKKGWALGMVAAAAAAGTLIGPPLGGILVDTFGWRSIFLVNLPFGILALLLSGQLCDLPRTGAWESFGRVLGASRFHLSLLATFFHYVHMFGTYLLWPFYLEAEGVTSSGVGIALLVPSIMLLGFGPWAGKLADQKGFDPVSLLGIAVLATFSCVQGVSGRVTLGLVGIGLGRALFMSANNAAVLSSAPEDTEALASGFLSTARVSGQAAGSIIAGGLWSAFEGHGNGYAFMLANLILAGGGILSGVLIAFRRRFSLR